MYLAFLDDPTQPDGHWPWWASTLEAADNDPIKAWVLDGWDWLPPLPVREFWRWKSLIFRNAKNRAHNTRAANPDWYK